MEGQDARLTEQLLKACSKNLFELVRLLLQKGALPNAARQDGWTPLMEAVESRKSDLVILLLKNGADRKAATQQGLTAQQLAQQLKLTDIARILD